MKIFAFILWIALVLLAACDKTTEHARQRLDQIAGKGVGHCVSEDDTNSKGDDTHLAFCTDGKTLVICTGDDGCITVNVTAELAP